MADPTFPYANGNASTQGAGQPINPYAGNSVQNPYGPNVASRVNFAFWRQPVYQLGDGTYWTPGSDGATYASSPWDKIYIGLPTTGTPYTPGIAKVKVEKFRDVDKKKSAGIDGARITIHGVEPAEVDIDLLIWTPEQLRQLIILWSNLFPAAYKGPPPTYSVQHPAFSGGLHSVSSVQFVKMEGPDISPDGRGMFRLKAWEFLKPGTKDATSTAAAPLPTIYDQTNSSTVATPGASSTNTGP